MGIEPTSKSYKVLRQRRVALTARFQLESNGVKRGKRAL